MSEFVMRFKNLIRLFESGNVCVFGLVGRGKDLLMSNVVVRRDLPYVSNIDYGGQYFPFDLSSIDVGLNTYVNFADGNIRRYVFPYPDKTSLYISDAGVYFPAQYCNELNKRYPYIPVYAALVRHLADANIHINVQNLNRLWDKLREMSDIYIMANWCIYFRGWVLQMITVYDRYESAVSRMRPFRCPLPMFANREMRLNRELMKSNFEASHGVITSHLLLYRNKSSYDTRRFKTLLEEGIVDDD